MRHNKIIRAKNITLKEFRNSVTRILTSRVKSILALRPLLKFILISFLTILLLGVGAEVLMEHLFHAVPIVNEHKELVGIVTTYDVLRYEYGKEYPESLDKFIPENM